MNTYTFTIHKNLDKKLRIQWERLWKKSPYAHMYNSPLWMDVAQVEKEENIRILTVHQESNLVALLPLVMRSRLGVHIYTDFGDKYLDHSSLLLKKVDPILIKKIITKLSTIGSFSLCEIPEEYITKVRKNKALAVKKSSITPYLPLDGDPLRHMSSKNRKKIEKRIHEYKDALTYTVSTGDISDLMLAFELDKKSLKSKKGKSTFHSIENQNFYKKLLHTFNDKLLVNILYYNNEPIISDIGVKVNNTYHALHTAYLEEYKFLNPGKLLLYFLLQELQKGGIQLFDFSRGTNEFKRDITPYYTQQYSVSKIENSGARLWLSGVDAASTTILESKFLYGMYCTVKKVFI